MKIKELIERTGVPKQTIHYYLRCGLLPKPRPLGPNSSDYHQGHVVRIRLIKELQQNYYLPLSVIKKILKKYRRRPDSQTLLKLKIDYFRPLDRLLAGDVRGEAAFLEATGLRPGRLGRYEDWGLITPERGGGEKVYSHDDFVLGKIVAQYRDIGLTAELGFEPDFLKKQVEVLERIAAAGVAHFFETAAKTLRPEEIPEVARLAREVTALFYYHLYHKLARKHTQRALACEGLEGAAASAPRADARAKEAKG
jgi:DNA-binding transcriptional MerR regulator